jgi:hypothetical protein
MVIAQLSPNLLRILSDASLLSNQFLRNLHIGMVLKGVVQKVMPDGKAVVQFQGKETLLQMEKPPEVGQTLIARVEQLEPAPILKIIPQPEAVPTRKPEPAADNISNQKPDFKARLTSPHKPVFLKTLTAVDLNHLRLSPEQEITVPVSRVLQNKTVVVEHRGFEIPVKTQGEPLPLPGSRISVKVEPLGDNWKLSTSGQRPEVPILNAETLRPYLPARQPVPVMLSGLEKAIQKIPVLDRSIEVAKVIEQFERTLQLLLPKKGDQVPVADRVREQVEQTGIFYESKVKKALMNSNRPQQKMALFRDLKGATMELTRLLEAESIAKGGQVHKSMPELIQILQQAADNIELKIN